MASYTLTEHTSGISSVPGFQVSALAADIRENGKEQLDMALIRNLGPSFSAAAVFTQNDIKAAPVVQGAGALQKSSGQCRAILVNSGNANACTGPEGAQDNQRLVQAVAQALNLESEHVLISSTGRIGRRLPIDRMEAAVPKLAKNLSDDPESGKQASQAILTSDTRPKTVTVTTEIAGRTITLAGIAKGAGMIQPDMATMLAYIVTDAQVDPALAAELLREVTRQTFNAITVDGDMSTNDTVVLMANGHSGVEIQKDDPPSLLQFREALFAACWKLASAIVGDGEKISRVVTLEVSGARSSGDAEKVARSIGNSLLVKSSWYGGDPNWGRILDAAGYARVGIQEALLDLHYNQTPVFLQGVEQARHKPDWYAVVAEKYFTIRLNLNLGEASFKMLASDLTEAYVDFNKSE